jgi:hypothetical protein
LDSGLQEIGIFFYLKKAYVVSNREILLDNPHLSYRGGQFG